MQSPQEMGVVWSVVVQEDYAWTVTCEKDYVWLWHVMHGPCDERERFGRTPQQRAEETWDGQLRPHARYWGHGGASAPVHSCSCGQHHTWCRAATATVWVFAKSWCDGKNWCLFSSIWNPQYGSPPRSDPENLVVLMSLPMPSREYIQNQKFRCLTNSGIWDMGQENPPAFTWCDQRETTWDSFSELDMWKHGHVYHLCYVSNKNMFSKAISLFLLPSWKEDYDKLRQCIKNQRHHSADKGLYSQSYGFSSSHVWMWELDHKEGWTPKNWCFWTVVLEKTLASPLNGKEIKPVNPKGNQSWILIGRTDAKAGTSILWPSDVKKLTHWKRTWCWERLKAGEGDDRGRDGWMASLTQWTWV